MSKKQKHTVEVQENGYIKRLPKAIVIGAKKSGTSEYQVDENYEGTRFRRLSCSRCLVPQFCVIYTARDRDWDRNRDRDGHNRKQWFPVSVPVPV